MANLNPASPERIDELRCQAAPSSTMANLPEPGNVQLDRALRVAARAALRTGTMPRTFAAMVSRATTEQQGYRRVAYRIERRTVALRSIPARGSRAKEVQAPPSPAVVDPWMVDPAALPATSEVVCDCLACAGAKKVGCPTCSASGRVRCTECGGGGRVSGSRGVKNCPSCRGQGTKKCGACAKGTIECRTCEGIGRVRAWLEVHVQVFVQVRAHPQTELSALHVGLLQPEDLDRERALYRVALAQDSQWIAALPEQLGRELSAELMPGADRVQAVRIQRFATAVHRFEYATRGAAGHVSVSGSPPAVLGDSEWGPLWGRLGVAFLAGVLMQVVGWLVVASYAGRAAWFAAQGNVVVMEWSICAASLAAGVAASRWWLPERARPLLSARPAVGAIVVAWLVVVVCWIAGGPSVAGVRGAIARGELAAAQVELEALTVVERATPQIAEVQVELATAETAEQRRRDVAADEAHLKEVREAPFAAEALVRLAGPWRTAEIEPEARALAVRRGREELEEKTQAGEDAALARLAEVAAPFDAKLAEQAQTRVHLVRAAKRKARSDFAGAYAELDGVRATDDEAAQVRLAALHGAVEVDLRRAIEEAPLEQGDLAEQQQTLRTAVANANLLVIRTGAQAARTTDALQSRLTRVETAYARENKRIADVAEKKRKAEAVAEARREAAEARREAAEARASAWRARSSDRVSCCDGTLSPSCNYSQGSLRGCCSHHGGVC